MARENIVFTSNDRNGVPNGVRRPINRQGVASLNYLRDFSGRGVETITARFRPPQHHSPRILDSAHIRHRQRVRQRLCRGHRQQHHRRADGNAAFLIEYDGNDHYQVDAAPVTVANFEANLTVGDTLAYEITGSGEAAVNNFNLTDR